LEIGKARFWSRLVLVDQISDACANKAWRVGLSQARTV